MRDPKRIKKICELLEKVWTKYPDQRLGQLLVNYIFISSNTDIFYQEDSFTEELLKKLLQKKR